MVLVSIVF